MAVTHFDDFDYGDEDYTENSWCGLRVGENYEYSSNDKHVTCKRCLKSMDKFKKEIEEISNHRNQEDAGYLDYVESVNPNNFI